MYKEKIIDVSTGEELWRDYTEEEIDEVEKAKELAAKAQLEIQSKELARKAIFEKLGLTPEEAAVLLG